MVESIQLDVEKPASTSLSPACSLRMARSKQPFPKLPSFPVAATLLSYMGYAFQVKQLLFLLSKTGATYWDKHREFLKSFVFFRSSQPFFGVKSLEFMPKNCRFFQWPSKIDFNETKEGGLWLKELQLKTDRFITGMKMTLNKGENLSQTFQGSFGAPHEQWRTFTVPDHKKIAQFGFRVDVKGDGRIHYTGVRALDQFGEAIFESEWSDKGVWEMRDVSNQVIIGFHGYIHMEWQFIHIGLLTLSAQD